ncbi:MAG: helix-turn-helix transcriptional regulator [Parvibaculum sp.]
MSRDTQMKPITSIAADLKSTGVSAPLPRIPQISVPRLPQIPATYLLQIRAAMAEQEKTLLPSQTILTAIPGPIPPAHLSATEQLGKMIREKRKALKLSQQEFADISGVGRRFISELERGKPSLEFGLVLQVCEAAGIEILAKPK